LAQDIVTRVNTFTAVAAVDRAAHAGTADSCNDCRKSAFDQLMSVYDYAKIKRSGGYPQLLPYILWTLTASSLKSSTGF